VAPRSRRLPGLDPDGVMPIPDAAHPIIYFKAMLRGFTVLLAARRGSQDRAEALSERAYESFARSVEADLQEGGPIACRGGCADCCTIRVAATAPEILSVARKVRALPQRVGREVMQKIVAADRATRELNQQQRMASRLICPLIENDHCVVYAVRPLACRGHASYDQDACREALEGGENEVPVSALHLTVRSLVQNALQAALRDAGLAWGVYELNQALRIALCDETCERSWMAGVDVFAPALITDVSLKEMAETFDAIKAMPA